MSFSDFWRRKASRGLSAPGFDQDWYARKCALSLSSPTKIYRYYLRFGIRSGHDPHPLFDSNFICERNGLLDGPKSLVSLTAQHNHLSLDPHPIFSTAWYVATYPDALTEGEHPWLHYVTIGWKLQYSPSPLFDVRWYLAQNPDVAASAVEPVQHYLEFGALEGRDPHPLFDTDWYLAQNRDVAESGQNPLYHYMRYGAAERRDPHPLFSSDWYLAQNSDVREGGVDPFLHFLQSGGREGRSPHPLFDCAWYLGAFEDARNSTENPLVHYLSFRGAYLRNPSASLNLVAYVERFPSVVRTVDHPLVHYHLHSPLVNSVSSTLTPDRQVLMRRLPRADGKWEWSGYDRLREAIRRAKTNNDARYAPRPVPVAECKIGNEFNFARKLSFTPFSEPIVTVIIPAFNKLNLTLSCLDSLMASAGQTPFEVLVADDASSDRTAECLALIPGVRVITQPENLGFLRNCNAAAKAAKGRYLLFLNNDSQVGERLIDALVAAHTDEVGIVGPKIIYPTGQLQEAGARIRVDGSAVLIGHGNDPDHWRYNFKREVDYVSGACLLIERALFSQLGGFDEIYAPCYCEDSDLCFRVRQHGLRVVYEPKALLVHSLSATMGDVSSDFKSRQAAINSQRFCERWQDWLERDNDVAAIAFYLPQFHRVAENDLWWGPGFTEWTNVSKAQPNYTGHDQPRLPADLGHYDLSSVEAIRRQVDLARRYGLGGFCLYHYWFGGRRVLEKPAELYLSNESIDFPFCLCWANENWTKRWDGQDSDVLLAQDYSAEDDREFMQDMVRFFADPRYIRIDGKPLLLIYRWDLLPDVRATAQRWREQCQTAGIGDIFLAAVDSFDLAHKLTDAAEIGFDAAVGFPPHNAGSPAQQSVDLVNSSFMGFVDNYEAVALRCATESPKRPFTYFPGAMPGWDNTPRRQDKGYILDGSNPGAFRAWIEEIAERTRDQNPPGKRFIFVNAWNEWGEGAYLEPDQRFGHSYLTAIRSAIDAHKLLNN
jgi:GT2 family glycosyltransferase